MLKKFTKFYPLFGLLLLAFLCFGSSQALADTITPSATAPGATTSGPASYSLSDVSPVSETSIPLIIGKIIQAALGLTGSFALFMFIYGGFTLLTSAGKPDLIRKGKEVMVWAVIGIVVILSSYALTQFVLNAFQGT